MSERSVRQFDIRRTARAYGTLLGTLSKSYRAAATTREPNPRRLTKAGLHALAYRFVGKPMCSLRLYSNRKTDGREYYSD